MQMYLLRIGNKRKYTGSDELYSIFRYHDSLTSIKVVPQCYWLVSLNLIASNNTTFLFLIFTDA